MKNYRKSLLILPVLLALLAAGIVMVLAMKMMVSMETGTIVVALLIPLLAYLLLSGTVEELAFGGVTAKFTYTANAEITFSDFGDMTPKASDIDEVGNQGAKAVEQMLQDKKLSEAKPIVFFFILGRDDYNRPKALEFIKYLAAYRSFKLVVFLNDRFKQVVAYTPFWEAQKLLTDAEEGERFISSINKNNCEELLKFPGVVTKLLKTQSTNAEALRLMDEQNLDALVVVDKDRNLRGVVERDDIVSKMMLLLVDKPKDKA